MPTISTFPNWDTNPYLNILYLEARARGWEVVGGTKYNELLKYSLNLVAGDILHIQWTSPFEAGIKRRTEYQQRISEFVQVAEGLKNRGVKILWTVHNLIAHQSGYPEEEIALAKELSRLADRIIILNSRTEEVAQEFYSLPTAKIYHLPHCSYVGVYPPPLKRSEVTEVMGIPRGFNTIGAIGAVRPYKGTSEFLLAASRTARSVGNTAILLAGETSNWAMKQIDGLIPMDVPIFRKHTKLNDVELAQWMSACDIMVLPYQGILNSGSMHLAATFGVPVVLPNLPHLVSEYSGEKWINFFTISDNPEENIAEIAKAIEFALLNKSLQKVEALDFANQYTPLDMTQGFANLLTQL